LETLRPAIIRDWRVSLPDAGDEQLAQLADRSALSSRGADLVLLAVFDGSEIAAHAELYLDRAAGLAQFERLTTHADYRGRGYATALVLDALRRSREAGSDLSFLTAGLDDWPREWYQRLGYRDAVRTHQFDRT
jgi:GNAT superfamily N-acetyltransferase